MRYWTGFTAIVCIASIWLVTRIDPSSVVIAEPAPYEYPDASVPAKPTRARRSDAGKARAPKPPAVAPAPKGVLDVDKLEALIAAKEAAKDEWDDALDFAEAKERAYDNHSCNLNDYLDSLRG